MSKRLLISLFTFIFLTCFARLLMPHPQIGITLLKSRMREIRTYGSVRGIKPKGGKRCLLDKRFLYSS